VDFVPKALACDNDQWICNYPCDGEQRTVIEVEQVDLQRVSPVGHSSHEDFHYSKRVYDVGD